MQKGVDFIGVSISYFCHDGNGNYVFLRRGKNARDEHGKWDCGGGGLEFGQTVEDCLKAEIKEEYCADIIESEFIGFYEAFRTLDGKPFGSAQDKPTHWIALHFKVLVDPKQVKIGEPHKFDELGWFRLDNLPPASELHSQLPAEIEKYKGKL
jgi:8-oxo-dGTP diphosphatase